MHAAARRFALPLALFAVVCLRPAAGATAPHYEMAVSVDFAGGSFRGDLRVTYENATGGELGELFFRLYPNATWMYGNAAVHITEARVAGREVETSMHVDDTVLLVPLPEPLAAGAAIDVEFAFEGTADDWTGESRVLPTTYGLLTRSERVLTLTAFYPILALHTNEGWALDPVFGFGDALMSDASSYDVLLTVPSGIAPVTSGTLVTEAEEGDTTTYHGVLDGARDFSVVLVDGYKRREESVDGAVLRAWFTDAHDRAADAALRLASDAVVLYSERIGPLRYREVDLVEVPLQVAAGVEFSGLILISSAYAARPLDPFFDVIVSHEMAHQWFYAGVGNDITEDPWLDESLATYLSYVFLDTFAGPAVAAQTLESWARAYERARTDDPHATITSPIYAFSRSSTYTGFVYSGGAVFLHAVREAIGDEPFFAALASYYGSNLGRIASPTDLITAFQTACACRLVEILDAYGLPP